MWLLHFLTKTFAASLSSFRVALLKKPYKRRKEGMMTTYCKMVHYLLETSPKVDYIMQMDAKILNFTKMSNMTATRYAKALQDRADHFNRDYNEYVLEVILIEWLHGSIRHSLLSYWTSKKNDMIHDLACHATSLTSLQNKLQRSDTSHATNKTKILHRDENDRRNPQNLTLVTQINVYSKTTSQPSRRQPFSCL